MKAKTLKKAIDKLNDNEKIIIMVQSADGNGIYWPYKVKTGNRNNRIITFYTSREKEIEQHETNK